MRPQRTQHGVPAGGPASHNKNKLTERKESSMPSFNRIILAGNLTRDPELRYTPNGKAVCGCALAVNRKWKTEQGEERDEVTFVDFDSFGRTAEVMAQYLKKGRPLLIEGRLKQDTWTDKQSGQPRSKLKVVVESFTFLDSQQSQGGDGDGEARQPRQTPRARQQPADAASQPDAPEDDDVPF